MLFQPKYNKCLWLVCRKYIIMPAFGTESQFTVFLASASEILSIYISSSSSLASSFSFASLNVEETLCIISAFVRLLQLMMIYLSKEIPFRRTTWSFTILHRCLLNPAVEFFEALFDSFETASTRKSDFSKQLTIVFVLIFFQDFVTVLIPSITIINVLSFFFIFSTLQKTTLR